MGKNVRYIFSVIIVCCLCLSIVKTSARSLSSVISSKSASAHSSSSSWKPSPWYLGIKGGIPFGISTFSSYGKDKMRYGYDGGIYGGYNINLALSVEAFYSKGKISGMSVQDDFGYKLVLGEYQPKEYVGGDSYNDIYSTATMQRYGIQWNIDIVQVLYQEEDIHFKLVLSPSVSAVSTKATIKKIEDGETVLEGTDNLNPALGSDLSMGYRLGNHVTAQIYTSFSWVFGDRIDGMPTHLYDDNFIMEYGIKLAWTFGKKPKKAKVNNQIPVYKKPETEYNPEKTKKIEPSIFETTVK